MMMSSLSCCWACWGVSEENVEESEGKEISRSYVCNIYIYYVLYMQYIHMFKHDMLIYSM